MFGSDECATAHSYWSAMGSDDIADAILPCPYTDLDSFVSSAHLDTLGVFLENKLPAILSDDTCIKQSFYAACRKHGDAIELQDNIDWPTKFGFKECRQNRGNPQFWKPNANHALLDELVNFIEKLPFFEYTGKVTIIINKPGVPGVEHVDHRYQNTQTAHFCCLMLLL